VCIERFDRFRLHIERGVGLSSSRGAGVKRVEIILISGCGGVGGESLEAAIKRVSNISCSSSIEC